MAPAMEAGLLVTIAIFLLGVVYQTGRLARDVEALIEWRRDVMTDIKAIRSVVDRIDAVLGHEARE